MQRICVIISSVAVCILLMQCNPFYATAYPYTPVHDGQNSLNVNCNAGYAGVNTAISYSPINHLYAGGVVHYFQSRQSSGKHLSGGPHAGYYFNSADSNFHFNFQVGYVWGESNDAYSITEQEVSGTATYSSFHTQVFVAHKIGKRKNTFFGPALHLNVVKLQYREMSYNYFNPDSLSPNIAVTGASIFFQHRLGKSFRFCWQLGFQVATSETRNSDGITLPAILRFGLTYQFHPRFRKIRNDW